MIWQIVDNTEIAVYPKKWSCFGHAGSILLFDWKSGVLGRKMVVKILKICAAAAFIFGLTGCDEGAYSDLKCDENYESECIDSHYYTRCGENGEIEVVICETGTLCNKKTVVLEDGTKVRIASCK